MTPTPTPWPAVDWSFFPGAFVSALSSDATWLLLITAAVIVGVAFTMVRKARKVVR